MFKWWVAGRWQKAAYIGTISLFGVWALWMVVIHVFLWTPLLRNVINQNQQTVHLNYRSGWSIWPGRVHINGLILTVEDHFQQFELDIDTLEVSVLVHQLPQRKFHAEKVRGSGIKFAMRRRLTPGEFTQEDLRGLPRIDGKPEVPLADTVPTVEDETPDDRYRMFSVWLEDIRGDDIRVLWFDKLRLEGKAQVSGNFYLKPQREVYIAPGTLHIEPSTFFIDGTTVAEAVQGDLELRTGPVTPLRMTPRDFVRASSLTSDLRGHLLGLELAGLKGGAGDLHVEARVKDGKLAEGNRIQVELGKTGVPPLETQSLSILVEEKRAFVTLRKVSAPGAKLPLVQAALFGDPPDLADLQPPKSMSLDLVDGQIDDAAKLTAKLPLRLLSGHGTFSAHLEGPASKGAGFVKLQLTQLSLDARNETFHADLALDARVNSFDFKSGANLSDTTVDIQNGGIKRDALARMWWGHIKLPRALVRFQSSEMFDGDLVADCRDARPIVGLYARTGSLPGSVKKLFTMDGLHVWGSAALGKGWVVLRDLHAKGDGAEVRAVFRHEDGEDAGAAWLKVGIIPLALGIGEPGKGLHILHPGDFFTDRKEALGRAPMLLPRKPRE
ncbi:MAG TPA: hypothetical protein VH083_24290 [Myxococcales bacterium]|jgi:hypothetical protein|nr:hypothetical protein [Myxococcales bacterium]